MTARDIFAAGVEHVISAAGTAYTAAARLRNSRRPSLLIYTDSRGLDLSRRLNRRNLFASYVRHFVDRYNATVFLYPTQYTTLVDFLESYSELVNHQRFDAVLLHAGIVDFSRRRKSNVEQIYGMKSRLMERIFSQHDMAVNLRTDSGYEYEGEPTRSFLSPQMAERIAYDHLRKIPNLLWVGCNPVLSDWAGTYWKARPSDINVILEYSRTFSAILPNTVDISHWSEAEIKTYTSDNVHFTKVGFAKLTGLLEEKLSALGIS